MYLFIVNFGRDGRSYFKCGMLKMLTYHGGSTRHKGRPLVAWSEICCIWERCTPFLPASLVLFTKIARLVWGSSLSRFTQTCLKAAAAHSLTDIEHSGIWANSESKVGKLILFEMLCWWHWGWGGGWLCQKKRKSGHIGIKFATVVATRMMIKKKKLFFLANRCCVLLYFIE